eukprot:173878-Hanusia_phi.AAC.1
MKYVNGGVAVLFALGTVILAGWTLNKSFESNRFPTSIVTHSVHPWNRLDKLEATLMQLDGTQGSAQANVQKLWAWAGCDKYITTGRVPAEADKNSLATVSANHPVYMPGGCNCLAQVGHAIGPTWNYTHSVNPTMDELKDMIRFCAYEADMPPTFEPKEAVYRPLFFFYAFMLLATGGIMISNFMHSGSAKATKDMLKLTIQYPNVMTPEQLRERETIRKQIDEQRNSSISKLLMLASGQTLLLFTTVLSFTLAFLFSCNSCDAGLKDFNLGFPLAYLLLTTALGLVFVIPYLVASGMSATNLYDALKSVVVSEIDSITEQYIDKTKYYNYRISDALNAQAQLEQLWTDILLIPAFTVLSVGITLTREWADEGIIFYNALLVFLFTVVSTAGNWVTCHWTRAVRVDNDLGMKGTTVYDFYQGYKDMITYLQFFILIALVFTAVPTTSITPYSYVLFYNWFYFAGGLFFVYIIPDIVNDRVNLTMHTVTAWKQLCTLTVVFTLLLTIAATELLTIDLFSYKYIRS